MLPAVIIEPLCAMDGHAGGNRSHRFIIMKKKKGVLKLEQQLLNSKSTSAQSNLNYLDSTAVYPGLLVFAFSYFRIKRNNGTFRRAE